MCQHSRNAIAIFCTYAFVAFKVTTYYSHSECQKYPNRYTQLQWHSLATSYCFMYEIDVALPHFRFHCLLWAQPFNTIRWEIWQSVQFIVGAAVVFRTISRFHSLGNQCVAFITLTLSHRNTLLSLASTDNPKIDWTNRMDVCERAKTRDNSECQTAGLFLKYTFYTIWCIFPTKHVINKH